MNNDLIRRGELLEKITKAQNMLRTSSDALWEIQQKYFKGLAWANRLVLDEPAVDAVEVFRCRDCESATHCEEEGEPVRLVCPMWGANCDEDEFCSRGERRKDDAHLE